MISWFYISCISAVAAGLLGFERLADLMLAAACVIGYLDSRIPREISVTINRPEKPDESPKEEG